MTLITILIALALVLWLKLPNKLLTRECCAKALNCVNEKFQNADGWLALLLLVVCPVVVLAVIDCLLGHVWYGFLGILIGAFVLWLCIEPYKREESNTEVDYQAVVKLFQRANSEVLAVIIWFAILGPFGALLYRLVSYFYETTEQTDLSAKTHEYLSCILAWLNWLPIRVNSLMYCLAGDFSGSFAFWLARVLTGVDANTELQERNAMIAMGLSDGDDLESQTFSVEQQEAAYKLIERVLIMELVILAFITLGSWLD